jgi:predicted  nucleic acid-binding Zn ribbon protein
MCTVKISFDYSGADEEGEVVDAVDDMLNSLRFNGQILGREHPLVQDADGFSAFVYTPAKNALSPRHNSRYTIDNIRKLASYGVAKPRVVILDADPDGDWVCRCRKRNAIILETSYDSLDSPLRCEKCAAPVPLYQIRDDGNTRVHDSIIPWMSDFESLHRLFMYDATGVRFAYREISKADSSLSIRGREICRRIESLTSVPTYYSLYCHHGRSMKRELSRTCPSCDGKWLSDKSWHSLREDCLFRCDPCRLVSSIALDVYSEHIAKRG